MITLAHGDHVKLAGWNGISVTVGTARGYSIENNRDAEAAHRRELEKGFSTAWTSFTGDMIYGDRAYGAMKAAERMAKFETATLLENGQSVEIEGETFVVEVVKRNEKAPVNSDPIHFIRTA